MAASAIRYDDLTLNEEGRLCLPTGEPFTGVTEDFYEDGQIESGTSSAMACSTAFSKSGTGTGNSRPKRPRAWASGTDTPASGTEMDN